MNPISVQPNLTRSFRISARARSSLVAGAYGTPFLLVLCRALIAASPFHETCAEKPLRWQTLSSQDLRRLIGQARPGLCQLHALRQDRRRRGGGASRSCSASRLGGYRLAAEARLELESLARALMVPATRYAASPCGRTGGTGRPRRGTAHDSGERAVVGNCRHSRSASFASRKNRNASPPRPLPIIIRRTAATGSLSDPARCVRSAFPITIMWRGSNRLADIHAR
jgi:hypothetical protein